VGDLLRTLQILVVRWIAFLDRLARIVRRVASSARRWKRNRRAGERDELVRCADLGLAEVPPGVSGERHGDVGQPDAGALVADLVHLGNEKRKRRAGAGAIREQKVRGAPTGGQRSRRPRAGKGPPRKPCPRRRRADSKPRGPAPRR